MIQPLHRRFSFGFLLATIGLSAGGGLAATLTGSAGISGVARVHGVMATSPGPVWIGFETLNTTSGWEMPEAPRLVSAGTAVMITAFTLGEGAESGEEIWVTPILSPLDVLTASSSPY